MHSCAVFSAPLLRFSDFNEAQSDKRRVDGMDSPGDWALVLKIVLKTCATCNGNTGELWRVDLPLPCCHSPSHGFDLQQFPFLTARNFPHVGGGE